MRLAFALALVGAALAALAQQPPEVQRALIERDQQSAEFAARAKGAPPAELQRLESMSARQLLEAQTNTLQEQQPYERQKAARETDAFFLSLPPPAARTEVPEDLKPKVAEPLERP